MNTIIFTVVTFPTSLLDFKKKFTMVVEFLRRKAQFLNQTSRKKWMANSVSAVSKLKTKRGKPLFLMGRKCALIQDLTHAFAKVTFTLIWRCLLNKLGYMHISSGYMHILSDLLFLFFFKLRIKLKMFFSRVAKRYGSREVPILISVVKA